MIVTFTKMHSLGNNFVVLDLIDQYLKVFPNLIRRVADPALGIGCDQVLTVEPPVHPESDFHYRVFNQDGSEAEQCGNGARCLAQYMYDQMHTNKHKMLADCKGGKISFHLLKNRQVSICFDKVSQDIEKIDLNVNGEKYEVYKVNVGNPHGAVLMDWEEVDEKALNKIGKALAYHEHFPNGCNIEFVKILNKQEIKLKVYERGVGFTKSCGTGALAAMLVANKLDLVNHQAKIHFQFGYLKVQYQTDKNQALMAGPTTTVFTGKFAL